RDPVPVDVGPDRLSIPTEVPGDRRDRPAPLLECMCFHVFPMCEHAERVLPSSWLLGRCQLRRGAQPRGWMVSSPGSGWGIAVIEGGEIQKSRAMPASSNPCTTGPGWRYCSHVVVTPLHSSSSAPSIIPQYTSSSVSLASRGHTDSLSQRSSGRPSPALRNSVMGECPWQLTSPGMSTPPRSRRQLSHGCISGATVSSTLARWWSQWLVRSRRKIRPGFFGEERGELWNERVLHEVGEGAQEPHDDLGMDQRRTVRAYERHELQIWVWVQTRGLLVEELRDYLIVFDRQPRKSSAIVQPIFRRT